MDARQKKLESILQEYGKLAVAFSGGADSTLLLAVARDVLAPRHVLALTAETPMHAAHESREASELAGQLGVRHRTLMCDTLAIPEIAANGRLRCYHCKRALFSMLMASAQVDGFETLADGTNSDDPGGYRPGLKAARELGVVSPLRDAGFSKRDVYELSALLELPTARKPATPCLATRVPYDIPLALFALRQIESAERALHDLGFSICRVRHHGELARVEVSQEDIPALLAEPGWVQALRQLGFAYVTIDPEGFCSGRFDEMRNS